MNENNNNNSYTLDDVTINMPTPIGLTADAGKGAKCAGQITSIDVYQDTDYTTKEPLTYANGQPKLKTRIKLLCFANTYDESLQGQEVALYVKNYGDNWQAFTQTLPANTKISDILKIGAYIEYVYDGKVSGVTKDGRQYKYNKFTLTIEQQKQ